MSRIYLDANATTELHPRVAEAMRRLLTSPPGNPSSVHGFGRSARDVVDAARERVADLIGADPAEVFFTSGGTESNNLFLTGCADSDRAIWITPFEHPSVREPARKLWSRGRSGETLPGDRDGAASVCAEVGNAWVSIQWINNETGVIQDLPTLTAALHEQRATVHTDGAQGFFRCRDTVDALGVDAATLTAHKSFGPLGVGVLYLRTGTILDPAYQGGPQERSVRPGTENVLAIHGLGVLAEIAKREDLWPEDALRVARDRLLEGLIPVPGLSIITPLDTAFPNVISCAVEDLDSGSVLFRLDRVGVAASSGSACSAGVGAPSEVLRAMGVDDARIRGAIRFSFTPSTPLDDLTIAGQRFHRVIEDLRRERRGSA